MKELCKQRGQKLKQVAAAHEKDASPVAICEYRETRDSSKPGPKLVPSQRDSMRKHIPRCDSEILKQILLLTSNPKICRDNEDDKSLGAENAVDAVCENSDRAEIKHVD
eukprot:bmy_06439T0